MSAFMKQISANLKEMKENNLQMNSQMKESNSQMNESVKQIDSKMKESNSQMNESVKLLEQSVRESINENIHAGLESFWNQIDIKFEKITEKLTEHSDTLQRFEFNMVDLRKALVNDDARLSDLNTRVITMGEQQALLQGQQKNEEERMVHLLGVNAEFQNKLRRVDSFSEILH